MTLRDLVSGTPFICGPDTTLLEVARSMVERSHGSVAVIDGRRLVGIVTERDVVRAVAEGIDLSVTPVRSRMASEPDVFTPETDVFEAGEFLLESGYRHLPVVDDGTLLGVVSLRDLLGAVLASTDE
ncbi:MAG TPA: CBS domain-containing protein [Acidimicrobiia bacterium]|nr:CBS domain-containing protein [Acidimicrobiia bacterium]